MRSRINERLERATRFPVTLIAAPAGFGKSVALRDFLLTSRIEVIRYDVRREDGTLLAFVRRLSEALEPIAPSALPSFTAVQERVLAADEPVRQLSDWFSEHLKRAVGTIVIDDLHYAAADPASIALLADLIERTSERIHWIIAARSDVGLPVATWIAYGRMDIPIGEDDLRFTTDEALAAADAAESRIEPQEIEMLRHLTEGWPVALTIALRMRTHSADLRSASSGARELVYRYLAEQIFGSLTAEQQRFAKETSVFSAFTADLAAALDYSPDFVQNVRARIAFLNEIAPGEYRYHDLFRDFLETELRRGGEGALRAALTNGAVALEQQGDKVSALRLYCRAAALPQIARTIEADGLTLFERGESEIVAEALDALPESDRTASAILLGLHAMIEASRGRYELADRAFVNAIQRADEYGTLRPRLVQRYATDLVRRGLDCTDLLEPYANRSDLDPGLRATILGTLATAYFQAARTGDALRSIAQALEGIRAAADDTVTARVFQQAAYVYRYTGSISEARSYAQQAVDAALKANVYEVAARAYSVLYTIVKDEDDDPISALSILDKLSECARKGASSQARLFALVAAYDIEVERGNVPAIERLDPLVRESRAIFPQAYVEGLLPADALRASWSGDFQSAYKMLAGTAANQGQYDRKALRCAEIALYAAAANLPERADEALHDAADVLRDHDPASDRVLRANLLLGLAELLRGQFAAAHQRITAVERSLSPRTRRLRTLANAVRAVYRARLEQSDDAAVGAALERLRAENFGGFARLLSVLPGGERHRDGYSALTSAERQILQMLVKGASTKEIAEQSGRSPYTVDTHVRAICRKLNCSGRREAIALATGSGWVQA